MVWWVAADAVRDAASLINADVINVHSRWKLHVLEILRLEGSFDEYHQIEIRHRHKKLTSHSQVEDEVLYP